MTLKIELPPLYKKQYDAIFNDCRYSVIEASTKSGKTFGCMEWLLDKAARSREGDNLWWVAPIFPQAKIAYRRFKAWLRDPIQQKVVSVNESELTITLPHGAVLWFKGSDRPDALYGEDVVAAVIDEASRCREDSWHAIRSTLTATKGPVRIIGNVKGRQNWAYKIGEKAKHGDLAQYHYSRITAWDAIAAGILDEQEILDAKNVLPARIFRELYEAEPADESGNVYSSFGAQSIRPADEASEFLSKRTDDRDEPGPDLLVGMDFNVSPMTAVVAVETGDQLFVVDEIVKRNFTTQKMAAEIQQRYPHARQITVYPDPSGRSRHTATQNTDFTILEDAEFSVIAPRAAPRVVDRINTVNAALKTSDGTQRLFVSSGCEELIDALWSQYYNDRGEPDKTQGHDHITDALGYLICGVLPLRETAVRTVVAQWG